MACLGNVGCTVGAVASAAPSSRRSANYQPTLWSDNFIQSLTTDDKGGDQMAKLEELKGRVRCLFAQAAGAAAKLELLDVVQRLGIAYHFEKEIGLMLQAISANLEDVRRELEGDLHRTALLFRLLREHGHAVPQDIFNNFMDKKTNFGRFLKEDVKGMLSLYEATFLAFEGERALDDVRAYSISYLKEFILDNNIDPKLKEMVGYALEMPLHWRAPRAHARWFIDACKEVWESPVIIELAKLNFNIVQRVHIRDIKDLSRWWEDLGLQKLSFARNRIMECFLWALESAPEPEFQFCRCGLTKIYQLIATIDDVYDVYGSIDELEAFTAIIERWDSEAAKELPSYMQACFSALFHTTNELADQCFKRSSFNCLSYLKKSWIHLCKCYLVEARWYHSMHMTTFDEYMANAWISISGPLILIHAYFMLSKNITKEALEYIEEYNGIIQWSSIILRLNDDLGTSTVELERGDIPKAVECHMRERNVLEAVAREHITTLISNTWKKINEECSRNKHLPKSFVNAAINLARMSHFTYQHGDGFGAPDKETKNLVSLMLLEEIH